MSASGAINAMNIMTWNIAQQSGISDWIDIYSPSILFIQEATENTHVELADQFTLCSSSPSHCGRTEIYVKNGINNTPLRELNTMRDMYERLVKDGMYNPLSGCCGVRVSGVAFISIHLAPFKINEHRRSSSVVAIDEIVRALDIPVIIAGDTNMFAANERFPYGDLWELAIVMFGDEQADENTWTIDKYENVNWWGKRKFNHASSRSRYDRIYATGLGVELLDFRIEKGECQNSESIKVDEIGDPLIYVLNGTASTTIYKSDHYAVVSSIIIA
jgi:hypothetical protein